jgi:hypothetical protein
MKFILLFLVSIASCQLALSQDDALSLLDDDVDPYVIASFKTTRIVNGHSIEQTHKGTLDFRINHRFGFINSGVDDLFGLDNASARIGFDYGLTDRWMVGFGRSGFNKVYDFLSKYKLLRQSTENTGSPVTMSILAEAEITTLKYPDPVRNDDFGSRLDYAASLMIARKFSEGLTLQVSPTWLHRNLVETANENNDLFALGLGGRIKISKRVTFNAEYFFVAPEQLANIYRNSVALGVDIETGGHVFQLHFTNSTSMVYNGFIAETTGKFFDGDIHYGFNISRVFTIGKNK